MPADPVRFFFDHHMWGPLTVALRRYGIDVLTAYEAGMARDDDPALLAFASANGRMIVTFDSDFVALHHAGTPHAGIAWCPEQKHTIGSLLGMLRLVHGVYTADEVINHLEYL